MRTVVIAAGVVIAHQAGAAATAGIETAVIHLVSTAGGWFALAGLSQPFAGDL